MNNEFVEPSKPFLHKDGQKTGKNVLDFWRWAYSELNDNMSRGALAEYIVAMAIGVDYEPKQYWTPFDLKTKAGKRVEVKNTAHIQTWIAKNPSMPRFAISPKRVWDTPEILTKTPTFNADIYVLCYFYETDRGKADPTNLDKWKFWVFSQAELVKLFDGKKSITVDKLEKTVNPLNYDELKAAIEAK